MDGAAKKINLLERASGKLAITFKRRDEHTSLATLYQQGCLKARFPKSSARSKSGYLINTTGGIADGDQLNTSIALQAGASAVLTTQAAERVYRARNLLNPAHIRTSLDIADKATLFWLPQETILFDGAAARRHYDFDIAGNARLLAAEMTVLGRTAMQEQVQTANLFDRWRVRVGGRLVFADGYRLNSDVTGGLNAHYDGKAMLAGSTATATMLYAGPGPEAARDSLRALVVPEHLFAGCSVRKGMLLARFASTDAAALSTVVSEAIRTIDTHLHAGAPIAEPILSRRQF